MNNNTKKDIFGSFEKYSQKSRVVKEIRALILDGVLQPGDQLPGELELSERFNISRGGLRDALQILEKTGFVIRRHGVGTFISENPLKSNNLNINWGVTKVIESMGAVPGTSHLSITTRESTIKEAGKLAINSGDQIVVLERLRTANEVPVTYTLDMLPFSLLKRNDLNISIDQMWEFFKQKQSLLAFFKDMLHIELHHAFASLVPLNASELVGSQALAKILGVPEETNILFLDQVEYMTDEKPVIYVQEYHLTNYMTFTVYRSY